METVGQRLRRLRQEAGLSQSDLASAMASASYISLVESDKRTPGPEVVRHLAERLACTPEYLLTGAEPPSTAAAQLELTFAVMALAEGDPRSALERLSGVILEELPDDLAEEVREATARAHLGVGDLERAIVILEPLHAAARRQGRALRSLALANTLTGSYLEGGDLTHAVELAEETLEEGRRASLTDSTEYIRLLATLTWALYERGDVYYARQRIREVLPRVEAHGDAKSRGSLYWNSALFAHGIGQDAEATALTRRALGLIAEHSDQADLARLRMHLGWLLLRGQDPDPASALAELEAAEPEVRRHATLIDVCYCLTEQARALAGLGRLDEALLRAQRGLDLLRGSAAGSSDVGEAPRYQEVQARITLAEIQDALGDEAAAAANYRRATDVLTLMSTGRKAAEIWGTLATRLQQRGDAEGALIAYQRAVAAAGIATTLGPKTSSAPQRTDRE